jgi:hypothetical protein
MPRGGNRAGAGRPRALSDTEALEAYLEYCKRRRELSENRAEQREQHLNPQLKAIAEIHARMRNRPIRLRKSSQFVKQDQEEVEDLLRSLSGVTDEEEPPRVYRREFRRPQSFRKDLFKELAKKFSQRLGKPVTPESIEDCIERVSAEFAELEKRLRDEETAENL